MIMLYTFVLAC